jgi:hypothetical protein
VECEDVQGHIDQFCFKGEIVQEAGTPRYTLWTDGLLSSVGPIDF